MSIHSVALVAAFLMLPVSGLAKPDTVPCRTKAESIRSGVFVQSLYIEPKETEINGNKVLLKEAWVEYLNRPGYLFGREIVGSTQKLLVSFMVTNSSLKDFPMKLWSSHGFTPGLWRLKTIENPLPDSENPFFGVRAFSTGELLLEMHFAQQQDQYIVIIADKPNGPMLHSIALSIK